MNPHFGHRISALLRLSCLLVLISGPGGAVAAQPRSDLLSWPAITRQTRPWAYWWWMGSAVDPTNLNRELQRYHDAGLGGVHIIPIYGAKGYEDKFIPYLSPKWMEMLRSTVTEAHRLDLGVDMTTGTGWCFGGPHVTDAEANASVIVKSFDVPAGGKISTNIVRQQTQALVAFSAEGKSVELTGNIREDGIVNWPAEGGAWRVYAISQRPSGQKVKRAAPGGEGHMLNLIYPEAMRHYLRWFDEAFAHYTGPKPRAMYHDSYEYRSDWSPDFFAQFEKRRGYRLQTELPALFGDQPPIASDRSPVTNHASRITHHAFPSSDLVARVKCDYRETVSDIMAEESLPLWRQWSRAHGFLTRNEAHGSPGNLLDLYAVADIPETEMFYKDRSKLVSKFASSAAHVTGKNLAAAETGTWLKEHFTETLADMKYLQDDMFLSGINHIFYHGACYSPDEAGWPGWHFYASFEMNPRNSIWRDVPALNAYAARCQAILQSGRPDNDILLYWPIYDFWQNPAGRLPQLTVHARDWFEGQAIGKTAERLWNRGFAFDYISDRQLRNAKARKGGIETGGSGYRVVVVPACKLMPVATLDKLLALARGGATVIFEGQLPEDVPGWGDLEKRRARFKKLLSTVNGTEGQTRPTRPTGPIATHEEGVIGVELGQGRLLVGDLEAALAASKIERETMTDHPGLFCVRRAFDGGRHYFIANRGEQPLDGWVALAAPAKSAVMLDPMSGRAGVAAVRQTSDAHAQVFLQLQPGESVIVRTFTKPQPPLPSSGGAGGTAIGAREASRVPLVSSPSPPLEERAGERRPFTRNALTSMAVGAAGGSAWDYWQTSGQPREITGDWQVKFIEGGPALPPAFRTTKLASWTELGGEEAQRFAGTALYTLTFDAPTNHHSWMLNLGMVCQSARVRLNGQDLGMLISPPFRVVVGPLKAHGNVLEVEVTNVSANRIRDLDRRGVKWKNFYDINFVGLDYRPFDASNWPLANSGLLGPVTLTAVLRSARL